MAAHLEKQPPAPSAVEPRVPSAFDALVLQMLAKNPAERPSQMVETEARLHEIGRTFDVGASVLAADRPGAVTQGTLILPDSPGRATPTARDEPSRARVTISTWLSSNGTRGAMAAAFITMLIVATALYYAWIRRQGRALRSAIESRLALAGEIPTPAGCAVSDPYALRRLFKAARLMQPEQGAADPAAAVALLADADPNAAETWAMVARGHLTAAANASALEAAQRATALCPAYASAHYLAGKAAHRLGRLDLAETEYRQSLSQHDDFVVPRFNLALVQLKRGDASAAVATMTEVIARRPDAQAFLVRGQARLDNGDAPGASSDLTQAIQRDPRNGDAWLLLGSVRARQGAHEEASAAFCRAKALGVAAAAPNCR
jgi:tetratricopeptide (TPR) repeat protein